jgi:hypothetical protein
MYQRLMVRVTPEERVIGPAHCLDVIDVSIGYRRSQSTSTGTDARHAEVLLSILAPLVTVATPGSAGSLLLA